MLSCGACVDRIGFDIGIPAAFALVIDGYISDQPGPYRITVNKAYDIESVASVRVPISVKSLVVSDNAGHNEALSDVDVGVYETSPAGIQGTAGRVYTLKIELFDGRVYESLPDTLLGQGKIDSLYYDLNMDLTQEGGAQYGFDILVDATAGMESNYRFLWKFTGTFRAETNPELADPARSSCEPLENGICNFLPQCSGIRNIGNDFNKLFVRVKPCECCTCWYNLFNMEPVISDDQWVRSGLLAGVKVYRLPLNRWIFMHKVYLEVDQMSLTRQTFAFWRSVKAQREAINSLFQPITGKIPSNFVQISGTHAPIEGLFFATSISSKSRYIMREDVTYPYKIPTDSVIFMDSCLKLFPNATNTKPSYWMD